MSKPYDSTLKFLVERYPRDWLKFCGIETQKSVTLIDSDLSTVTAAVDRVIVVEEAMPFIVNIELQASYDRQLPERMNFYSVLLSRKHGMPVHSVAVLLRPEADGMMMSGTWTQSHPRRENYLVFSYDVIRVWTQSADQLLQSGAGILPLAGITDDAEHRLSDIILRANTRIDALSSKSIDRQELVTAEFVLLGLRHSADLIEQLLKGVLRMEESTTYQLILAKGREEGREEGREAFMSSILKIGRRRFGIEAAPKMVVKLRAITDVAVLEEIQDRALDSHSWDELFAE